MKHIVIGTDGTVFEAAVVEQLELNHIKVIHGTEATFLGPEEYNRKVLGDIEIYLVEHPEPEPTKPFNDFDTQIQCEEYYNEEEPY